MILFSPFEQFLLDVLFIKNSYFIVTEQLIFLCGWVAAWFFLGITSVYGRGSRFNFFVSGFHVLYTLFYRMMRGYIGPVYYKRFFPFFFYLFVFLATCNLLSLLPFTFTLTSHFFVSLSLSATIWFTILFIGVSNYGVAYLRLYYPAGINTLLMFILVLIETMSVISRMFSLSLRLTANMIAGHLLLDCLCIYISGVFFNGYYLGSFSFFSMFQTVLLLGILTGLFVFELFVCFLQAYIFVILSTIYLLEIL